MSENLLIAPAESDRDTERAMKRPSLYPWLRAGVAIVLVVAATLKGYQAATEPMEGRPWLIVQVQLEWFMGLWLLSGLKPRLGWLMALLCFAVFAAVAAHKACQGAASCGCFGKLQVNPWHTVALDLAIVTALLLCRPRTATARPSVMRARWLVLSAVAAVTIGGAAAVKIAIYQPGKLQADSQILGDRRNVLLEPANWVGQPLGLSRYIDVGPQLMEGKWMVVFYHHDCPYCREVFQQLDGLAVRLAAEREGARLAAVEMPPYGELNAELLKEVTLSGRMANDRHWLMETPTVLWLDQGIVTRVQEDSAGRTALLPADLVKATVTAVPASMTTCDLGFVEPGSTHKLIFTVTNPTTRSWTIRRAVSECKCTVVREWPKTLRPGQTGELSVVFSAPNETQRYSKAITLVTDDPSAVLVRSIRARIGLPLQAQTEEVDLGSLASGADGDARLVVLNQGSSPVRILYGTSPDAGCLVLAPQAPIPPNGKAELSLHVTTTGKVSKPYASIVQLHTDSPTQPELGVRVRYAVTGSYPGP